MSRPAQGSLTAEQEALRSSQGYFNGFGVAIKTRQGALRDGFDFADVQARKPYDVHTLQNFTLDNSINKGSLEMLNRRRTYISKLFGKSKDSQKSAKFEV